MNILITGASGFLASNLLKHIGTTWNVCLTGRHNAHSAYKFKTYDELFKSEEKFDIVFHLASYIPLDMKKNDEQLNEVNVDLTSKLTKRFKDSLFIYASSVSVYPLTNDIIDENTITNSGSFYGNSKLAGEELVKQLNNYRIVRFSSIYGIGMKENTFLPMVVNATLRDKKINVWGDGKRLQNYIEVSDAARYLLYSSKCPINGTFLGTGTSEISNKELAELICNYVDDVVISFVNEDNSPSFRYNNKQTLKLLNWSPETKLEEGIKNYITWKKEQY